MCAPAYFAGQKNRLKSSEQVWVTWNLVVNLLKRLRIYLTRPRFIIGLQLLDFIAGRVRVGRFFNRDTNRWLMYGNPQDPPTLKRDTGGKHFCQQQPVPLKSLFGLISTPRPDRVTRNSMHLRIWLDSPKLISLAIFADFYSRTLDKVAINGNIGLTHSLCYLSWHKVSRLRWLIVERFRNVVIGQEKKKYASLLLNLLHVSGAIFLFEMCTIWC